MDDLTEYLNTTEIFRRAIDENSYFNRAWGDANKFNETKAYFVSNNPIFSIEGSVINFYNSEDNNDPAAIREARSGIGQEIGKLREHITRITDVFSYQERVQEIIAGIFRLNQRK